MVPTLPDLAACTHAPAPVSLWRGVSNLEVRELLERGGTLIAPTSLSTDRAMAIRTAIDCHGRRLAYPPTLLRIRSAGASGGAMAAVNIGFLSLFPHEAEYLLPPGVYLHCAAGEAEVLPMGDPDGGGGLVQVELRPIPLRGAWVPVEHNVQRALAAHAESGGGKGLTPRMSTPRMTTPRAGSAGYVAPSPRGRGGLLTPRQAAAAAPEAGGGLW